MNFPEPFGWLDIGYLWFNLIAALVVGVAAIVQKGKYRGNVLMSNL